MIYTYGYISSYEEHIEERKKNESIAFKLGYREKYEYPDGKVEPYLGGAIWATPEEGYQYIDSLEYKETTPADWAVYALEGTWENVYYIEGEPFHRLKVDCPIIGKVERNKLLTKGTILSMMRVLGRWQNGYAADCKSVLPQGNVGSIPARPSNNP